MASPSSRRDFLAAGIALPTAGLASTTASGSMAALAAPPPQSGNIQYRTLGKTGLKVTPVGFGCMITSDASVISRAVDMGINHFDTSRDYQRGNNERMVGAALGSNRKEVVLSTKTDGLTKESALEELDTSLAELKTDYLDIWYLHDKSSADQLSEDLIAAQQEAKKAGKIRFTGVSVHAGHKEVIPAAIKSGQFDVLLTTYNFGMGTSMDSLIESARSAGMGVVAMKVIAGSFRLPGISDETRAAVKRSGAPLAALKWALRNQNIGTTIPSMTDNAQLEDNFQAMSTPFSTADEKILAMQLDHIRPLYCRMCGSCTGQCPQGLPVADMLRVLTYADGYGQFPLARERFLRLPKKVTEVRCSDCSSCTIQCPNGVRVQDRLIRAQELFA